MAKASPSQSTSPRPPIITIMGHVDHGKTTLLDALRESRLVDKEFGGITQHIGAYQIDYQGRKFTFIDTPGHAAFSKMRARGASVTDIVILVVAADDGVKPQTVESIRHIKKAQVPFIVAINKIDAAGANPESVKAQLTEHEVFVEKFGGDTPVVEISAKQKKGLSDLLEVIALVAELEELKNEPQADLSAVVIESELDKHRGPMATLIIKTGTLHLGDTVYNQDQPQKIKAMFNDIGVPVKLVTPGYPVSVMGLKLVPDVGGLITQKPHQSLPEELPEAPTDTSPEVPEASIDSELEETKPKPAFNLILKADAQGTLEAIIHSALHDEVTLISKGVGPINESDILLAQITHSLIIGFNIPITPSAKKLAKTEKIAVKQFNIIYKLLEFLEEKILTMIEPTINEEDLGTAQVAAVFNIRNQSIAGCKVTAGKIDQTLPIHLVRKDKIVKDAKIKSLKSGKDDISVAKSGTECGIILEPILDVRVGDVIKSYRIIEE